MKTQRGQRRLACRKGKAGIAGVAGAVVTLAVARAAFAAPGPQAHANATRYPPDTAEACLAPRPEPRPESPRWPAPLDRAVTWRGRDVRLRDALDRLAAAAHVRLSYASDLLPLDRRVCAAFAGVPLGDALAAVLGTAAVDPIAAGVDQVVLAPARRTAPARPAAVGDAPVLDRVVVTGNATGTPERGLAVAPTVIGRSQLAGRGVASLADLLGGAVPGVWAWEQEPASFVARYAGVRGASSFGVSAPKVYIDGVEVANPVLLSQLDADALERIEVTRGPQGAALYGAGALDGVVHIVTRHAGADAGGWRPQVELRSRAGMAGGQGDAFGVLAQDHGLTLRAGSAARSASVGVSANTLGEFAPGAFARRVSMFADGRLVGARAVVTGTARMLAQRAGDPQSALAAAWPRRPQTSPLPSSSTASDARDPRERRGSRGTSPTTLADSAGYDAAPDPSTAQSLRQYTLGTTVALVGDGRWTHTAVVGVDGYRLSAGATPLAASAADSALSAARGGAARGTFRASSVARLGNTPNAARSATITLAAEHSVLRDASAAAVVSLPAATLTTTLGGTALSSRPVWRSNTGLVGQADVALRDAVFLTAGARLDRTGGYTTSSGFTLLPTLGVATVREIGAATIKLRTAYGRGVRPAQMSQWSSAFTSTQGVQRLILRSDPAPEAQAGVEAGADLQLGRAFALRVTRFDQRASGLVQPVLVASDTVASRVGRGRADAAWAGRAGTTTAYTRLFYQLQNVGEIANRGWELDGRVATGPLSLTGALSLVDSRVRRVATGYGGDLRAGDRMLDVPARTATLTATWSAPRWSTSWSLARASDWVGYDRLAIADAATRDSSASLVGAELRAFWRDYPSATRLRATFSRDLSRGVALTLTGDNLLDRRTGEPDNGTVLPGRTVTAGVRAKF